MVLDLAGSRQYLKDFDFKQLFTQELGWDHHNQILDVLVENQNFRLTAIAQKRGMVAFVCSPSTDGSLPAYPLRRKIDRQVAKSVYEHIIIFVDQNKTTQIWQWVKREIGKPVACREHYYNRNQSGDGLVQKIDRIAFTLDSEPSLTLQDVTRGARSAFDVERVTRSFYERFKTEHGSFYDFIKGIPDKELQRWYASIMLNRLMFIYFIQKKGFLNNDVNYLKNRLAHFMKNGKDLFYTNFLTVLFFEGFAKQESERSESTSKLLGKIPYLNGGLFLQHQIEEFHGKSIRITDKAFENLFDFFEQYQWHLDERPLRDDREINPDVLGYIFEKYINQKQMGAYYTKEDITGYISRNTVIPRLFDIARQKCKIAFEGKQSVWKFLQAEPDRYIYDVIKHGISIDNREKPPRFLSKPVPLPEGIQNGIGDISKRGEWSKKAPSDYSLSGETWREIIARRQRYEEIHKKLSNEEIHDINDLITYNLNIEQFALDVLENCEGPELLRAFWHAIEKITVLDPTCGSGAFLFAALNILESLYAACLNRMRIFVDELEHSGEKHRPEKYADFKTILKRVDDHPNEAYFIFKSIIVNNLYGVDVMEEAVEICKLRLFLKLVAQINRVDEIEPLPDIDFNIKAGNTLIGFVQLEEVRQAIETVVKAGETILQAWSLKLEDVKRAIQLQATYNKKSGSKENPQKFLLEALKRIEENAENADREFQIFHLMQTKHGMEAKDFTHAKEKLRSDLDKLAEELSHYLASEYGLNETTSSDKKKYDEAYLRWRTSHKPLHWFTEFYGIMKQGGFDVIIGNPPYVEYRKVKDDYSILNYKTEECGNLYAFVMERSLKLRQDDGRLGIIVPISMIAGDNFIPLSKMYFDEKEAWVSSFSNRPGKLFAGVEQRLIIIITSPLQGNIFSSDYQHWYEDERPSLFPRLSYGETLLMENRSMPFKNADSNGKSIIEKLLRKTTNLSTIEGNSSEAAWYHDGPTYWIRALPFKPASNQRSTRSNHYHDIHGKSALHSKAICSILASSTFYFFFKTISNCRDFGGKQIYAFPVGNITEANLNKLAHLAEEMGNKLRSTAKDCKREYPSGTVTYKEYYPSYAKTIIDQIDAVLAEHYDLSTEELDFVINYEIKYRMGQDNGEEEE